MLSYFLGNLFSISLFVMLVNIKEIKNFYHEDCLNKGYKLEVLEVLRQKKTIHHNNKNSNSCNNIYQYKLPELEVIERYEELAPGFTNQLLANIKLEQKLKEAEFDSFFVAQDKIYRKIEIIIISILTCGILSCLLQSKYFQAFMISIITLSSFLLYLLVSNFKQVSFRSFKSKKKDFANSYSNNKTNFVNSKRT